MCLISRRTSTIDLQSDESIWGCEQVNLTCTAENGLWPCGTDDSAECIRRSRVCDGMTIKEEANNCPEGKWRGISIFN